MTFKQGDLVIRKEARTNGFWFGHIYTVKNVKVSRGSWPVEILFFAETEDWHLAPGFELVEPLKYKLEDFL